MINVSVLLPVTDELTLLETTVRTILTTCDPSDLREIIFIVGDKTTPASLAQCQALQREQPTLLRILRQTRPFLGGAMQDGFDAAQGTHTLMMSSDMETDPRVVRDFIRLAKERPASVITGSRWLGSSQFKGYNPFKLIFNFLFQKFFSALYACSLSDMTYGYRLFPSSLIKSIIWQEKRHAFLFETILKPLRMGVDIVEWPAPWTARDEGQSHNRFLTHWDYIRIGLQVRFQNPATWKKRR